VTDLDRCSLCASVHLVRRLGEVECRDCGAEGAGVTVASGHGSATVDAGAPAGLAEEVEQALARVLRPTPTRPPTSSASNWG